MKPKAKSASEQLIHSMMQDLKKKPESSISVQKTFSVDDLSAVSTPFSFGKEANGPTPSQVKPPHPAVPEDSKTINLRLVQNWPGTHATPGTDGVPHPANNMDQTVAIPRPSSSKTSVHRPQSSATKPEYIHPGVAAKKVADFHEPWHAPEISPQEQSKNSEKMVSALVSQSDVLQLAQAKIRELETEIDQLRLEYERLQVTQAALSDRAETLESRSINLERKLQDSKEIYQGEIKILKESLLQRDVEIQRLKQKESTLDERLAEDIKKIRSRERDLENRLEIGKHERIALTKAKDENILHLKEQLSQQKDEIERYKNKIGEFTSILSNNQDQVAKTVRALRLALTSLEVSDQDPVKNKKTE